MLTSEYPDASRRGSRAGQGRSLSTGLLTEEALGHVRALDGIAQQRGVPGAAGPGPGAARARVTTVLIGASSVASRSAAPAG